MVKIREYSTKNRNLLILGVVLICLMFVPVFAGLTDSLMQIIAHMTNDIVQGGIKGDALGIFLDLPANMEKTSGAWTVVRTINETIIKPVAISIVGLCFFIRLAQMVLDYERMLVTPERFLGPIIQCAAVLFLVDKSFVITEEFIKFGVTMASTVHGQVIEMMGKNVEQLFENITRVLNASTTETGGFVTNTIIELIDGKLWQAVVGLVTMVLPWFISVVINLLTKIVAYGVIIELLVRASFVPLFAGDVMLHGFEGRGFAVLKGFLAACCNGALFIIIIAIVNAMKFDALSPALSTLMTEGITDAKQVLSLITGLAKAALECCIYAGAGLALTMKSSEIIRSVFGA